jgi:hypothetical protein
MTNNFIKVFLALLIGIAVQGTVFGQWQCFYINEPEEALLQNGEGCELWENYAPYPDMDMVPIKNIRIAYHVLQDENGENNLDDVNGKVFIHTIINYVNNRLADLNEPHLDEPYQWPAVTSPWITQSRIHLVIDTIFYHHDDENLWDWTDCSYDTVSLKAYYAYEKYVRYNSNLNSKQRDSTLHIILGGGGCEIVGGHVPSLHPYKSKYIAQNGIWHAFNLANPNFWVPGDNTIHEFGHVAGLRHNFHGGQHGLQCDDCTDNDPEGLPCPIEGTSNNCMDYSSSIGSFSQCQLGKMHYYLTGQANLYEHVGGFVIENDCSIIGDPYTIEPGKNVVWMHNNIIGGDLVIEQGATLTIMCTIKMKENARVIVKRGGKLIIDEGVITSACPGLWPGIEVWGNSDLSHIPTSNQGVVVVKNGGVVENAIVGIKTYRPVSNYHESCWYGYTGGIVQAYDAVFRNNRIAVEFLPYDFQNNLSVFMTCEFHTGSSLIDGSQPNYFVKLNGVQNIEFIGCTFKSDFTANIEQKGSGIFAANADVLIKPRCKGTIFPCPEQDLVRSNFENLYYGVLSASTGTQRKLEIDQTIFNQNYRGILNQGHNFAAITRNQFQVFPEVVQSFPETWGLRMEDAEGFMIEENYFKGSQHGGTKFGTGLVIQNSGENPNLVYNNAFETLRYAAFARRMNRNQSDTTGLCFKCNDFDNNTVDIYIHGTRTEGIATHQGADIPNDNTAPAGNIFSRALPFSNFYNETFSYITYFKHWGLPEELIPLNNVPINGVTTSSVWGTTYNKENSCPSNLGGGAPPIEEMKMMVAGQQSDSLSNELAMYVDDGDTEVLTTDVMMTTQYNAEASYLELMQTAPYLSDTVLKTVIVNEAAFTNPMIRDVMVASPQSGKSDDILDMLEAKSDPMPESMMADIYDGRLIVGGREKLEAELAHWRRERYKAFTNLYRWYSADTICMYATDSLIALLNAENNAASQYKLAFLYLDGNETLLANQTLAAIPAAFNLDADALITHQAYTGLADIWLQILNDSVYFINPGETIISDLMALYNAELGLPSIYARNILLAAGALEYDPDIILFGSEKRDRVYRRSQATETSESRLKLYPNPAKGVLTIEYQTDENTFSAIITITGIDGGMVMSESLPLSSGSRQLSLESLLAGSYLVQLMLNDKPAAIQRLQIIK